MTNDEPRAAAPPQSPRGFKWAPLAVNGGLLLALTVIVFISAAAEGGQMNDVLYMVLMMLGVGTQGVVNALIALTLSGRKDLALSFLLSAIAVGLIGTGLCFGGAGLL